MNAKFPFLTKLFGKWEDAQIALADGLDQMGSQIQTAYGTFDSDITVPAGKLTYTFGTWTPVDNSAAHLVLAPFQVARYVRIGRLVFISGGVSFPATADGNFINISVPFPPARDGNTNTAAGSNIYPISISFSNSTIAHSARVLSIPITQGSIWFTDFSGSNLVNSQYSGKTVIFGGIYETAAS